MIIVDVGCMPHGREESIHRLIDRFHPELLYGFDPHPDLEEGVTCIDGTVVVRRRAAAWTHAAGVPIIVDGITTGVAEHGKPRQSAAHSIDLPAWLWTLPRDVVLKLDCEGAEYPLLTRIAELELDERLAMVLVEWHPPETAHGMFASRPTLDCPVEEW